ncbi:hypothetical protein [Nostoc sp. PCC 7524]|uniref:hypothetical protein n=1 Tax=Nostoc sp. (strain ATCC 29411 / PCC 7524) TaxID=28072 RepID=UPI0005A21A87|nr:hypothetical protein [Nostoc sp. PCC 7524]
MGRSLKEAGGDKGVRGDEEDEQDEGEFILHAPSPVPSPQSPIPNPQSPIPSPQSPINKLFVNSKQLGRRIIDYFDEVRNTSRSLQFTLC